MTYEPGQPTETPPRPLTFNDVGTQQTERRDSYQEDLPPVITERPPMLKRVGGVIAAAIALIVKFAAKVKGLLILLPKLKLLTTSASMLVSGTVKDLIIGSGIDLVERGTHELKGVPGSWQLFAVGADDRAAVAG